MTNVLLISEDYIKENTAIDDNVYGKYLLPAIREAQDMGLQTIIGGALYQAILGMVADRNVNEPYTSLIEGFIQPYLAYKVVVDLIPILGTKIANLGLISTDDEKAVNISKNDRDRLADYYQFRADFYCRRLQEYLCSNREMFPELRDCDCDLIKANLKSSATSPIWLGGAYNK